MEPASDIKQRVQAQRREIIQLMRDICAIPSMESQIGPVGERIIAEMKRLLSDVRAGREEDGGPDAA